MHVREISQPSNTTSMPLQDHGSLLSDGRSSLHLLSVSPGQHQRQNSVSSGKAKGWQAGNHQFTPQEEKKYVLTPLPNPTQKGSSNSSTSKCSEYFPFEIRLAATHIFPTTSFIHPRVPVPRTDTHDI